MPTSGELRIRRTCTRYTRYAKPPWDAVLDRDCLPYKAQVVICKIRKAPVGRDIVFQVAGVDGVKNTSRLDKNTKVWYNTCMLKKRTSLTMHQLLQEGAMTNQIACLNADLEMSPEVMSKRIEYAVLVRALRNPELMLPNTRIVRVDPNHN